MNELKDEMRTLDVQTTWRRLIWKKVMNQLQQTQNLQMYLKPVDHLAQLAHLA